MAASERPTTAARSGIVPIGAIAALWLACVLLGACLNPRPEEVPTIIDGPGPTASGGGGGGAAVTPGVDNQGGPGDGLGQEPGMAGSGATSGNPMQPGASEADGPPDAGAEAGPFDAEAPAPEGETEP